MPGAGRANRVVNCPPVHTKDLPEQIPTNFCCEYLPHLPGLLSPTD